MMKRHGFTLIELLAVIVIMDIIVLIATPLILNVIEKAKKGAFQNSVYGIMKAAELFILEHKLVSPFSEYALRMANAFSFLGDPINRGSIESFVFATNKTIPGDAIWSWDVSEERNGSVIAWYTDSDNNGLYEVTIADDGKVYANENSMGGGILCVRNLHTVDLTNIDTSNVTAMSYMFENASSLENIDFINATFDFVEVYNYILNGIKKK